MPGIRWLTLLSALTTGLLHASDQPQWGSAWNRNMVSAERGLPDSFDPATGRNIRWSVRLGTETHSTPVVADGRVYIGTNNGEPRDPRHEGDRGVLMCFDEVSGRLQWQLVVPKRDEDPYFDWPKSGISSPATVDGNRVYVVSNRGEVVCLDTRGLADGNDGPFQDEGPHMTAPRLTSPPVPKPGAEIKPLPAPSRVTVAAPLATGPLDADIVWIFDMVAEAGIWPHDGAHSSILVHGDHLYLNTATGVDNTHKRIRTPDAPSLIVLDKRTGRLVAREREGMAPNIFHCTWSAPSLGTVNGRPLIFFAGGNGIVYAFEPFSTPSASSPDKREPGVATLRKVLQFDFDPDSPKQEVHRFNGNRRESPSNFYGMPVFLENRLYVAGGGDVFWGKNEAWLKCIDVTGQGQLPPSAVVWSYPLQKHVLSTPAIDNGLVFIADTGRTFHCLDARTGRTLWTHEIKGEVWASPLVADGKVYLGTRSGAFYIFAAAREKTLLSSAELGSPISATATAANRTLYIATMTHLHALQQGAHFPTATTK